MKLSVDAFICACILALIHLVQSQYTPDWESIDSRPLPDWYDQGKVGIFVHWGVYSAPAHSNEWFGAEWFEWAYISGQNYPGDGGTPGDPPGPGSPKLIQFMQDNYPPGTTYKDLAKDLTGEHWNPDEWVQLFERAGAKYTVLTSKHHEGFTMWPSKFSDPPNWNSVSQGPHRDIVGDFAAAVKRSSLRFGLYYSLCEWLHPLWLQDKRNGFSTNTFVEQIMLPKLYELIEEYQPDVVWSDGEWSHDYYWQSTTFLAWLYNSSPVKDSVVVNDRWGWDTVMKHGGYWSGPDKWNPGELVPHKWESCFSLDKYSWGFRTDNRPEDYMTPEEIITTLVYTVAYGGNVLINVSPTTNGSIPLIEQGLLAELGDWLRLNGDAIYNSVPHTVQKDITTDGVWFTSNTQGTVTYALITRWPTDNKVTLGSIPFVFTERLNIQLLGNEGVLAYTCVLPCDTAPGIVVTLPTREQVQSKYAWVLAIRKE